MSTQEAYPNNGWTRVDGDLWGQWFGRRLAIGRFALGESSSVVWLSPAEAAALAEFLAAPTQGGEQ